MPVDATLNPAQVATLAALGAGDTGARTAHPGDLAARLRTRIEGALAGVVDDLDPERPLVITKRTLNGVHGCQARYLHEKDEPFEITVPIVRGTIAHKALELAVNWPGPPLPLDLVDAAVERIGASDHWAADWVATAPPADRAELRGAVVEIVNKFLESWPPLTPAMRPTTEAKLSTTLCDGRIVLRGQVDLTLGQAVGSGNQARKIIVDYKTGGHSPEHRADLRFYALVEALRLGVPPRLGVTAYLNSAELECEEITAGILDATAARVTDGIGMELGLADGTLQATRRPSGACRWCALAETCSPGQEYLADFDR